MRILIKGAGISCRDLITTKTPSMKELRGCDRPKQSGVGKLEEIEATRSHDIPSKAAQGSWDATDSSHVLAVKAALHLSALPDKIICRESESSKVIKFCKTCLTEERAGSIYICGCPGTGKSLTIEKVKLLSTMWSKEAGKTRPNMVSINSTSLTDPSKIYLRVLQGLQSKPDNDDSSKSNDLIMRELKRFLCASPGVNVQSSKRMVLLIVDEMDYLISRDQSVLYELFRLSTFANSRLILIGIANAIDLTDRLLPKLRSMNCKVDVVTFPAYTKDQILAVLQQRLSALPYPVFQPAALELCARKVAAASGDMRKALHVCRSAVELVETKAHASRSEEDSQTSGNLASLGDQGHCTAINLDAEAGDNWKERSRLVGIEIMAKILSQVFRSPVMETIQALPRHQQMVLCAAVCRFRRGRKDCNLGELNTGYLKFCKTTGMQPLTTPEFSSVCQVLADQALLCLGTSREDRLRRVTLKVDEEDVILALQGVRFLRACLP